MGEQAAIGSSRFHRVLWSSSHAQHCEACSRCSVPRASPGRLGWRSWSWSWFDGDGNTTKDNSSIKSVNPSALGRGRINYVYVLVVLKDSGSSTALDDEHEGGSAQF